MTNTASETLNVSDKDSLLTKSRLDFKELYIKESEQLEDEVKPESIHVCKGEAGEPWVAFTPQDRLGLCLSGGGIRSATFNLGLMQAFADLGILKEVHCLSTVSGGGYIGGFWTAWLQREGTNACTARFPRGDDEEGGESAEVRHLREFSRFLLPRVGILETEFWGIAMTVLGGLIPSFLTAIAMLFLGWSLWVALTGLVVQARPLGVLALVGLLAVFMTASEIHWANSRKSEHKWRTVLGYVAGTLFCLLLALAGSWFRPERMFDKGNDWTFWSRNAGAYTSIFAPALLFGACTLIALLLRVVLARILKKKELLAVLDGFERSLTRFLALTVAFTTLATLWWLAGRLQHGIQIQLTALGAATSAGLFAWAKEWLQKPVEETHGSTLLRSAINRLKRGTPKLLAWITCLLLFILVGTAMHKLDIDPLKWNDRTLWYICGLGLLTMFLTAWLFDPARVGMHEFYRSRISRCYLGASNPDAKKKPREHQGAAANRQIIERENDDLTLEDLKGVSKLVHLICTAANDISGDTVGTLYRGARSAVLSANGISIGDETAELKQLRLSAALTASAAAFNSQMGRISIDLGRAVTFLMSALNLRLGLWVPHPNNRVRRKYRFPGRFFLYELLGRSRANAKNLHLSDGNHFENFGLYELIRRHVRYIIVSDCGADPEVAFDDLANVLRRVREDFGVELELDIRPLLPGEGGFAKQHAVVGTIHYNGPSNMDKGTILFFKPALTGDEPPDVLQYHTRNRLFPHESTGDQFYDGAQWESYRRLGHHAGRMVVGFFEKGQYKVNKPVDRLFRDARSLWHPAPDQNQETFLKMTERFAVLEGDIVREGPKRLAAEFFSELSELVESKPDQEEPFWAAWLRPGGTTVKAADADEEMRIYVSLLRALQIMEDVWLAADLEQYWSHPLNQGWLNYFQRWARTPSFRRWWPVLAPIYSPGFREFVKERFGVGVTDQSARGENERRITAARLELKLIHERERDTFFKTQTWRYFEQHAPDVKPVQESKIFSYELQLLGYDGEPDGKKIVIGFAIVEEKEITTEDGKNAPTGEWAATWRANELFVPLALTGSGIIARLLDALIKRYRDAKSENGRDFRRLEVEFSSALPNKAAQEKPKVLSQAARYERVRDIEFYKSRNFSYVKREDRHTGEIALRLVLSHR